jgi:serine/threonine-protein kinase
MPAIELPIRACTPEPRSIDEALSSAVFCRPSKGDILHTVGAIAPSPRMLGRYALYSEIASGGMATVHLGRLVGASGFTKTVAIKRLHPQFAKDPEFVVGFLDEARLASRIQHPNVVSTLDVVATDGDLFLVMEYIQGESLARLQKIAAATGRRIPPEIAVAVIVGTLHGLHAAHEALGVNGERLGIVHRDVSPQNILVAKDGAARVLDFGVAKAVGRSIETRDGAIKGKLPYMAPEQFSGQASSATDVYAASIVLWETLVGRPLFRGENDAHTLQLVLSREVEPPGNIVPALPLELDEIVLKGLARDPARRFRSAREMARALERAVPMATASEVGEFVLSFAGATIAERASQVAYIESASLSLPLPPASVEDDVPTSPRATSSAEDPLTQLSTISDQIPVPAPGFRLNRTLGATAAILAMVGLVVVAATARRRAPSPARAEPPSAETPMATVPIVQPSVAFPTNAVATSAESESSPTASAEATTKVPRTAPSPADSRRRTTKGGPNCSPPFTVDDQGFRHYKRECN